MQKKCVSQFFWGEGGVTEVDMWKNLQKFVCVTLSKYTRKYEQNQRQNLHQLEFVQILARQQIVRKGKMRKSTEKITTDTRLVRHPSLGGDVCLLYAALSLLAPCRSICPLASLLTSTSTGTIFLFP